MDKKSFLNTIYNSAIENNQTTLYSIQDFKVKAKEILKELSNIENEITQNKERSKEKYNLCNNKILVLLNNTNHLTNERKYVKYLKKITKEKEKINVLLDIKN